MCIFQNTIIYEIDYLETKYTPKYFLACFDPEFRVLALYHIPTIELIYPKYENDKLNGFRDKHMLISCIKY